MNWLDQIMGLGDSLGLQRTNVPMTDTTSRPRPGRSDVKDIDDPSSPLYRQRHGGSVVTGLIDSVRSAVTLPRDVYQGTVDLNTDEATGRVLDMAGAMNLGSFAAAPAGAVGSGLVRPASRAQSLMDLARQYDRPQTGQTGLKTGYSGVKHERPFEDMTRTVVDDPTNTITPAREADLASMVGGYMIPLVGDRTEAGKILTEINGTPLYHGGTRLEGGFQYGQSQASRGPDRSGWASHYEPISTLHNRLQKAHMIADGRPVYGAFSGMGERAGDFSTMNADALMGLVPASGMKPGQMAAFDEILRKRLEKEAGKQGPAHWPGLENLSGSRDALLARSGGELRKAFVETADSASARSLGMPDVAAVRKATTHPDLLGWQGAGASGGSIVRFDENGLPIRNPSIPHGTYPSQYPGEYIGQTRATLDRNELFPRTTVEQFALPRSTGDARTWANVDRAFMTNAGLLEKLDQEWLDTVMAAQERRLANGR